MIPSDDLRIRAHWGSAVANTAVVEHQDRIAAFTIGFLDGYQIFNKERPRKRVRVQSNQTTGYQAEAYSSRNALNITP